MNTRMWLCTTVLAAPLLLAACLSDGPADSLAGPGGESDRQAQLVPSRLPRTPDAVEGWFRTRDARQAAVRACQAQLVPALLPHIPDAAEGWFRTCYARQVALSVCRAQLVPSRLPHTPDAVEGWFRSCYAREVVALLAR